MKGPAELIVSLFDLCEAEGRLLEVGILRTVRRVALLCLGLLLGTVGLGFLVAALYGLAVLYMPAPAALALIGLVCAGIAALLLRSSGRAGTDAEATAAGVSASAASAPQAAAPSAPSGSARARPRAETASAPADSPHPATASGRESDGGGPANPWAQARPYHENRVCRHGSACSSAGENHVHCG